jgi:hypothetical protein
MSEPTQQDQDVRLDLDQPNTEVASTEQPVEVVEEITVEENGEEAPLVVEEPQAAEVKETGPMCQSCQGTGLINSTTLCTDCDGSGLLQ